MFNKVLHTDGISLKIYRILFKVKFVDGYRSWYPYLPFREGNTEKAERSIFASGV